MRKFALIIFFLSILTIFVSCQNNANTKKRIILFENTKQYDDKVKTFTIDPKAASEIYSNWYTKKFNLKDPQKMKRTYDLLIDDSYFFSYDKMDKRNEGIPLVGVLINGNTGEITEINWGKRIVKTYYGYKEIKMD